MVSLSSLQINWAFCQLSRWGLIAQRVERGPDVYKGRRPRERKLMFLAAADPLICLRCSPPIYLHFSDAWGTAASMIHIVSPITYQVDSGIQSPYHLERSCRGEPVRSRRNMKACGIRGFLFDWVIGLLTMSLMLVAIDGKRAKHGRVKSHITIFIDMVGWVRRPLCTCTRCY